jgi:hypothetical protein
MIGVLKSSFIRSNTFESNHPTPFTNYSTPLLESKELLFPAFLMLTLEISRAGSSGRQHAHLVRLQRYRNQRFFCR